MNELREILLFWNKHFLSHGCIGCMDIFERQIRDWARKWAVGKVPEKREFGLIWNACREQTLKNIKG